MTDYIPTRSKSAGVIWQILCEHPTGLSLRKIAAYYRLKTGEAMPNNHQTTLLTTMQANNYFIFYDNGKYYPFHDDVSGQTFEHESVGDTIRLVTCV